MRSFLERALFYAQKAKEYKEEWDKTSSPMAWDAFTMNLFQALNYAISFLKAYIRSKGLGFPEFYADIPEVLYRAGRVDEKGRKWLGLLMRVRNKIAHEYGVVREGEVLSAYALLPFLVETLKRLGEEA